MRTYILILLLLIFSSLIVGLNSQVAAQNNQTAVISQTNQPNSDLTFDVEDVLLNGKSIWASCASEGYGGVMSLENIGLNVSTIVKGDKESKLTYYYTVSDGQIVGQGANVVWDFKGAKMGEHTITVGVGEDFVIRGKLITKTVRLSCHTIRSPGPPCECPAIEISGPAKSVNSGDTAVFVAKVMGRVKGKLTYNWTSSGGTIIAGQETLQIMVKTIPESDSVTATFQTSTDAVCDCMTKLFKTVSITRKKP